MLRLLFHRKFSSSKKFYVDLHGGNFIGNKSKIKIDIDDLIETFDLSDLEFFEKFQVKKPKRNDILYFKCKSGLRAEKAVFLLKSKGYLNCFNLHCEPEITDNGSDNQNTKKKMVD
jgi:rhodanese-related sulfurtransferase